jgi:hypothetical protein
MFFDEEDCNEVYRKIMKEREWVDIKEYSHNIISLELREIARKYNDDYANKMIILCNLEELGWEIKPSEIYE